MTIRLFFLSLLCLSVISSFAQSDDRDSLLKALSQSREDTMSVTLLGKLGYFYLYSNLDSSYFYTNRALRLSQAANYRKGQAISLSLMSDIESYAGNYPQSLKLDLEALQIAEGLRDNSIIAAAENSLGALYYFEKDYSRAQAYFFSSSEKLKKERSAKIDRLWANIGDTYLAMHRLDSALFYTDMAYKISAANDNQSQMADELDNLGDINAELGKTALAHQYYRNGLDAATRFSAMDNFCVGALGSARLFKQEGRNDSALAYAYQAIIAARSAKLTVRQMDASNFIESIFESNKMADSSLKYLKLTIALQDSLYSQEKSKAVQNMTFEENIRQQDLALQRKQAEDNAVKNRQLLLIALFIPIFFLVVVFLARIKVKPRVVEFLAIVNLLLFFEFITDVTFPYISDWTHDSPAWEMLILVLIAAGIEPLNYRIERWVKVKLTRRVDPAAAQN